MSETNKQKHYGAIDGLRAFSAIGIVLMHVLSNGNYGLGGFVFEKLIPSFTNLVFLFMVISGFAMCCGYYDKIVNNKITVGKFYSKRYAKIWPFFAILCLLDFVISPSVNSFYEVFANLTLCFGLLPNANITVIGVGWFLGLVFVFYLIFPFFCYLISDKRRAWFSFAVAFVFNLISANYFNVGRTNIVYSAVFFFAGGLIYIYRDILEKIAEKYHLLVALVCVLLIVEYYVLGSSVPFMLVMFSLFLIYTLGIISGGGLQNCVTKFLSNISMEIYLCHMVMFRVIEKAHCTHLFKSDGFSYVVTAVGTIAGAIVFSLVVKKGLKLVDSFIDKFRSRIA